MVCLRHLRCDGKEPSCLNCENRRAPCVYLTEKNDENISNTTSSPQGDFPQLSIERPTKKRKIAETASTSATDSSPSTPSSSGRTHSSNSQNHDWPSPMVAPHSQHPQQLAHTNYLMQTSSPPPPLFYSPFMPPMGATPMPLPAGPQPFLYQPHLQHFPPTPTLGTPTLPVPIPGMPYLTTGAQYCAAVINSFVLPIASPRPPVQAETSSLKRFLETEKHRVHLVPTSTLVKAFGESVIFAYGNRYSGNQPLSKKYADKAFQIMLLIIATRSSNTEEFASEAQSMTASMEILSFYMVGSLELSKNRYIIDEAKRLWEMYPNAVKTPTVYRILTMHVGLQVKDEDTLPLLKIMDDFNLPMDESGVSGYVALIVMITGRYSVRENLSMLVVNPEPTPEQVTFWTMVSEMADKATKCVDVMEANAPGSENPLARIYRGMILGARGIVSWRLGDKEKALAHATAFLEMGYPPPGPKLAYLLGFGYALQIFRMMGRPELLKRGLPILDTGAAMFPMLHHMAVELRRPYRPEDYMTSDTVTLPPPPAVRPHPYEQLIAPTPPPISAIQPTISNLTAGDAPPRGPDDPPPAPTPPPQAEEVTAIVGPSWTAPPPPPLSPSSDAILDAVNEYFGSYLNPTAYDGLMPLHQQQHFGMEMWNQSPSL
eukprot:TRINITY_DN3398_c0_g3_i2.p1 TRINITY_DN3398_c0_g3~~TRINITY_DN3398_c0_g3_i2.p1  ORF type:complete len:657 (-),score=96.36 TRINITY_DN3398_c0_g3_i2:73-2043(-)